jgi:hypothetical protein
MNYFLKTRGNGRRLTDNANRGLPSINTSSMAADPEAAYPSAALALPARFPTV